MSSQKAVQEVALDGGILAEEQLSTIKNYVLSG